MTMRMEIQPTSIPTYETADFWLAAALLASGRQLLRLRWEGRRAYFVFDEAETCDMTAQAYWLRDLKVIAKDFADALRTLKDRLHGDNQWKSQSSSDRRPS
jgi:hypothetical protein